jgi:hypothetical protein
MSQETSSRYQLYFDEPRLRMTVAGRILVRVITYVVYLVLFVTTATFFASGGAALFYSGIFLLLVIIDLVLHHGEGDLPISEISKKGGRVNLAKILNPQAFAVLDRAADRTAITKKNFYLEVARRLLDYPKIEEGLAPVGCKARRVQTEARRSFGGTGAAGAGSREDYLSKSELLVNQAFREAVGSGHDFIMLADLFSALMKVSDTDVAHVFDLFSIEPSDLEQALIFGSVTGRGMFGRLPSILAGFASGSRHVIRHRIMNRAWTSRPTPTLDRYGTDLRISPATVRRDLW